MLSFFKTGGSSSKSKLWIIMGGAVLGVLLILLGNGAQKSSTQGNTAISFDQDELILYQDYLEERVINLCQSVSGVGKVTAVVTLEGGFEEIYATQWESGEEVYVILGNGSSASPLQISRALPQIAGIGIVCDGGGNAAVRQELIDLLSATFDVATHRIHVTVRSG